MPADPSRAVRPIPGPSPDGPSVRPAPGPARRAGRPLRIPRTCALLLALLLTGATVAPAQEVPTPESHFGFPVGADRRLADWDELTAYYARLAETSPRVALDTLGTSTRGRPFVMLTITSPGNHARLEELREVQMKLADPRRVSGPGELEALLERGRTVVLITHAIHSTEVGSAQVAARLAHRMASSDDPEVLRILDEVILLQIPSLNPDGTDWVVEWYREHVGTRYEGAPLPWLYHFYVGHDNNRDWYAFTQKETQLTVQRAHNAWHPQIVHDIHQMGGSGARIFFPPYIDPWEPNVDPALVSAVGQLGTWMAARLTADGKEGVLVNGIYDAFTPARAYQHYHAGARILSETASADMASPVEVDPAEIGGGREYDASRASWNYPLPWQGGRWGLPDIVEYMDAGAMALLENAARNRRYWLENFHRIGERAVRGWDVWPDAWVVPASEANLANETGLSYLLRVLAMGDVEVHRATTPVTVGGRRFPEGSWVVPTAQPYGAFAQTLLEVQEYPDLREYEGGPPKPPYDVTAHTLPLLLDVEAVAVDGEVRGRLSEPIDPPPIAFRLPPALRGDDAPRVAMYKAFDETYEAGWTRWVFDRHRLRYDTLRNADIRRGGLRDRYDVIVLQSQAPESILRGFGPDEVPLPFSGGVGQEGLRALEAFVRAGGRLVAMEEATELVTGLFDLPLANAVERLPTRELYVPGSILALEVEQGMPLTRGVEPVVPAWYWRSSRAFRIEGPGVRVAARYGAGNPLLSGWILGAEHLAGEPALVTAEVGEGSVVLFGFQPNYRAQSVATWPLLFNALVP